MNNNILASIKGIIKEEMQTIQDLYLAVDENFSKAVKMIFKCPGKLIITGMGKSGLVAQKISATMVSTGTPAIYLHPSEALHGDIGIARKGDLLLAIGKSGETEELIELLPVVKKIGVKIISITSDKTSTLADNSDIILFAPVKEEAGYQNIAPTSSTTAALVIGDALALTLMKLRGFQIEDFAKYHPGGLLGKTLILEVSDIMRGKNNNPVICINSTISEMFREITEKGAGAVSVVDKNHRLCGLITDKDLRSIIEKGENIFTKKVTEIMNPMPTHVFSDEKAIDALELMEKRKKPFTILPVLDKKTKKVVGMLHLHDILASGLKTKNKS